MITLSIKKYEEPVYNYTVTTSYKAPSDFTPEIIEEQIKLATDCGLLEGVLLHNKNQNYNVLITGFKRQNVYGFRGNPMVILGKRRRLTNNQWQSNNDVWDTTFSVEELLANEFEIITYDDIFSQTA